MRRLIYLGLKLLGSRHTDIQWGKVVRFIEKRMSY